MLRRLITAAALAGVALTGATGCAAPTPAPQATPIALVNDMEAPVLAGKGMVVMGAGADEALVERDGMAAYRAYLKEKNGGGPAPCGGCPRVVVLDAAVMPFITRNIKLAAAAGKPTFLTKVDEVRADLNRKVACRGFKSRYIKGSCDEYPFASSAEGGAGARVEEVPAREQSCQGNALMRQYGKQKIVPGSRYHVAILNHGLIETQPFVGQDRAKYKGPC